MSSILSEAGRVNVGFPEGHIKSYAIFHLSDDLAGNDIADVIVGESGS